MELCPPQLLLCFLAALLLICPWNSAAQERSIVEEQDRRAFAEKIEDANRKLQETLKQYDKVIQEKTEAMDRVLKEKMQEADRQIKEKVEQLKSRDWHFENPFSEAQRGPGGESTAAEENPERMTPEARQLEVRSNALASKYRSTQDAQEKEAIKHELHEVLNQLFEEREKTYRQEVEDLEKRLSALKSRLEQRDNNKERIVEDRLSELIGEGSVYNW